MTKTCIKCGRVIRGSMSRSDCGMCDEDFVYSFGEDGIEKW